MNQNNLKIIYLGTPELSLAPLKALLNDDFDIVAVFCRIDKKKGRGKIIQETPVKRFAKEKNIPIYQPKNKEELHNIIKELKPDLGIVFAYGIIIKKETLEIPKHGFLNIHLSLLPKYRGSSPVLTSILEGDKKTGVSIIKITERMDAGPVIIQSEVDIEPSETTESLCIRLANLGASIILETIPEFISGKLKEKDQNVKKVSYCRLINKEDGRIDWNESSEVIGKKVRAFYPWPGTFTFWDDRLVKIIEAVSEKRTMGNKNGEAIISDSKLFVQTGKGSLEILKLQLEGKKIQTAQAFIGGYKKISGSVLK